MFDDSHGDKIAFIGFGKWKVVFVMGHVTPCSANRMLRAIGMTKDDVADTYGERYPTPPFEAGRYKSDVLCGGRIWGVGVSSGDCGEGGTYEVSLLIKACVRASMRFVNSDSNLVASDGRLICALFRKSDPMRWSIEGLMQNLKIRKRDCKSGKPSLMRCVLFSNFARASCKNDWMNSGLPTGWPSVRTPVVISGLDVGLGESSSSTLRRISASA